MARHIHIHVHDSEWKESDHPRDDDGKFGSGTSKEGESGKASKTWEYKDAGIQVDGLMVRKGRIDNYGSIEASLTDFEVLQGVREVPFADFEQPPERTTYTEKLAAEIAESEEISPLIVVIDSKGPYILEGAHRYDALQLLGKKSFPALVVIDKDG